MDLKEIQNLIRFVAKSGASEVKLEMDDIKITIKTANEDSKDNVALVQGYPMNPAPMVAQQPAAATPVAVETEKKQDDVSSKFITIKSPIIGTFYRKPSPDKPPFVEVGAEFKEGDVLCVIEAMKLFNEIESEISGKIIKVLVDDASPVEFDQPLFLVDPA